MKHILILMQFLFFYNCVLQAQWIQTNISNSGYVYSLTVSGNNIFAGTDNGVYLSTNSGASWAQVNNGLPLYKPIYSLNVIENSIFTGTFGDIYLSTSNGTNWAQADSGIKDLGSIFPTLAVQGTNIYTGTWDGVHLSTNNGTSWTKVDSGLYGFAYYRPFIISLAVSGTNVFVGTFHGVSLSTNNGTNWTQKDNGLTDTIISSIAVNGSNIFVGTDPYYGGGSGSVFLSTNMGTNWIQANNGLTSVVWSFAFSGINIFAGTGNGVFLSTNNGNNWTQVGLTNIFINALTVCGTNLFAGTDSTGVWRRPLSELTGVSNEEKVFPKEFTLFQNYPNPFNPSTVIKYSIPSESNVNIKFYNSLGQIVREVNEGNRQPGNYEINFNSSGLASGMYFYSLKAISSDGKNDFTAVKKMILLK